MGNKVLLIDGDLRKPQLHYRLGLNNTKGFSNVLTNEIEWNDATQTPKGYQNLSILPAGIIPPDPIRLLSSNKLRKLLKEFKESQEFDFIIIDTPPLLGLSDASLISKYTDGLMLLVSVNKVQRNLPIESKENLKRNGTNILGVLVNNITQAKTKKGTSYGQYGYGGYGYGGYGYGGYGYAGSAATYAKYSQEQGSKEEIENDNEINTLNQSKSLPMKVKNSFKNIILKLTSWLNE